MSLRSTFITASALILAGAATAGAAEPTPLTGTEWALNDAPEAFFTLNEDGTINGNDGCNIFGGSASLEGNALTVDGLYSTMRYCDMDVSLTAILDGENTVAVTDSTLTLTDAKGTEWAFTAKK